MSAKMIEPDLGFIKDLSASGADTVKKCYQCATCSVVCNIAPEGGPFPRKEMIWAQWGLSDKLAADPDVWLCHNCGDCTTYCPRGAKPAEVLGILRKATIKKYALIKPLAGLADNFFASLIVAAIVIFGLLAITGHLNIVADYRQVDPATGKLGPIIFNNFVNTHYVDALFVPLFMLGVITALYGILKFWDDICESAGLGKFTGRNGLKSVIPAIIQVLKHDVFGRCGVNADRKVPHMLALYSFIALFITTNWAVVYLYLLGWEPGSYSSLANPLKWLGNLGAIMLIAGSVWLIMNRKKKEETQKSSNFDWNLLWMILLLGITGFLAQLSRLAGAYAPAQVLYVLHLIFIAQLFIFAPYSKLAHLFYRTTAMVFAKHSGRELVTEDKVMVQPETTAEEVAEEAEEEGEKPAAA